MEISFQRRQLEVADFLGCGCGCGGCRVCYDAFDAEDLPEPFQRGVHLHLQVGQGSSGRIPCGGACRLRPTLRLNSAEGATTTTLV